MKLNPNKIKSTALLLMVSVLSMGNESCEKAQQSRSLRMEIELGAMGARPIRLPSGEVVDFPYVANAVFYRQVMDHSHFMISTPIPNVARAASAVGVGNQQSKAKNEKLTVPEAFSGFAPEDLAMLEKYGFMSAARTRETEKPDVKILVGGEFGSQKIGNDVRDADIPACTYLRPLARIGGDVLGFEATWGAGVGVGYGVNGTPVNSGSVGLGGSVNFDNSRLDMAFRWDDLFTEQTIASADGVSHQSKVKLGVNFGSSIPIGLNLFFNEALVKVIRSGMTRGLNSLVDSYVKTMSQTTKGATWHDVWESRVIYEPLAANNDTHVAIKAGLLTGLKKGDTFSVQNLTYSWEGAPCSSRLRYVFPKGGPVAEIEIIEASANISIAEVKKTLIDENIKPGARIRLLKLSDPPLSTATK